jgi:DNA-directed RNA polymerase subunit RPC12/RpoP
MTDGLCHICRRRDPAHGRVCDVCSTAVVDMLNDLPRKLALLPLMLMPGQSPGGEKVTTTRVGSPTPARLDALSLVGPGSVSVPAALHPMIRRWSTSRDVQVDARVGTYRVDTHTTTLTEWHQELVVDDDGEPVLVADDDQIGALPPAEWLDQVTRKWRAAFGHSRPPLTYVQSSAGPRPPRDLHQWVLTNGTPEQIKTMFAVEQLTRDYRQGVNDLVAGKEPGYGGHRPANLREDDPVADAWELRFGDRRISQNAATNIKYLRTWWERACASEQLDVCRFAAELRSMSAELTRVLGEQPDHQWLGRCPARITDKTTEQTSTCGAGLWQDPHASVVECPRCHSSWGPRMVHLMHLAAEIRRVWPLDRRRRYNADEIDALRPIRCPECTENDIEISWQEVSATTDNRRWWRPTRTRCSNGCAKGRDIL